MAENFTDAVHKDPSRLVDAVRNFDPRGAAAAGPIDVIDLFSGCGGLSCGFEVVGRMTPSFRLCAATDIDQWANATYARNFPIEPFAVDLAAASEARRIEAFVERLPLRAGARRILIGGPPCQGFSAHRKKSGPVKDRRNELVGAFARLALELEPELILMENVPEILSKAHWRRFQVFRRALENAGYFVSAQIHNLAAFGVPQERFRALIVAFRRPVSLPEGFLEKESFRSVRDAIGDLRTVEAGEMDPEDSMHVSAKHKRTTIETIRQVPPDGGRRPRGVGPACLDRVDGYRDVYGRMYWDRPSNTITAYARNPASGRYVHPEQHRGLTIREAALLQGFPRRFIFEGPFDEKFAQIGNAVPPIFAAFAASHVLDIINRNKGRAAFRTEHALTIESPTSNSFSSGIAGRKR